MSHGGGINGFATMIVRVPEKKLVAVALSNVLPSQAGKLANELALLALGEDVPPPGQRKEIQVSAETMSKFVGEYQLRPGFMLVVTLENHQLMTQATGQVKIPIFAESETRFFLKVVDATIEFQRDEKGAVTSLVLEQDGNRVTGKRTK